MKIKTMILVPLLLLSGASLAAKQIWVKSFIGHEALALVVEK
jgi:hypothetical protein